MDNLRSDTTDRQTDRRTNKQTDTHRNRTSVNWRIIKWSQTKKDWLTHSMLASRHAGDQVRYQESLTCALRTQRLRRVQPSALCCQTRLWVHTWLYYSLYFMHGYNNYYIYYHNYYNTSTTTTTITTTPLLLLLLLQLLHQRILFSHQLWLPRNLWVPQKSPQQTYWLVQSRFFTDQTSIAQ